MYDLYLLHVYGACDKKACVHCNPPAIGPFRTDNPFVVVDQITMTRHK